MKLKLKQILKNFYSEIELNKYNKKSQYKIIRATIEYIKEMDKNGLIEKFKMCYIPIQHHSENKVVHKIINFKINESN